MGGSAWQNRPTPFAEGGQRTAVYHKLFGGAGGCAAAAADDDDTAPPDRQHLQNRRPLLLSPHRPAS